MNILTIIGMILIFGFLIFIHELGHFITARLFKVGVNEFSLGMGPALFSRTSRKSGIKYSLRALPIGGYVSMVGEDKLEADDDASLALCRKPAWQRFIVMAAGAAMNLLFGFIIMFCMVLRQEQFYGTTVDSFIIQAEDGMYYRTYDSYSGYGLKVGDEILMVGNEPIRIYNDLSFEIMRVGAEPTNVTVMRDGVRTVLVDVKFPTYTERGIVFADSSFIYPNIISKNPLTVLHQTLMQSVSTVRMIYESLFDTLSGRYGMEAVSGPVGVVETLNDTVQQSEKGYKLRNVMYIVMVLTINLGIMNLLPFPALDGGRIFFIFVELLRGKPVKPEFEGYIHLAGMVVLMMFMVFVTFNDIVRIIGI
ncbi:MAG: site-2 protease family protein [Clostridia bacterium]|nr:site-2 protease family protein [Clostridia bacterium]